MPPSAEPAADPLRSYAEREARFGAGRARHEARTRALERVRLATAIGVAMALALAHPASGAVAVAWMATAGGCAITFLVAVVAHGRARDDAGRAERLERVNRLAAKRALRAWDEIPLSPASAPPHDHPYADDLDIFGRASLWQLLPQVSAAPARDVLRGWLLAPATPAVARERQRAVAELAGRIDLRDALGSFALTVPDVRPSTIEAWGAHVADDARLSAGPALVVASFAVPVVTISSIAAAFVVPPDNTAAALAVAAASALAALVLSAVTARRSHALFSRFVARADTFELYAGAFDLVAVERFQSPLLVRLFAEMGAGQRPASDQLRRLGRLVQLANTRYSPMLHLPVQLLTLWDLHVARGLERWSRECGPHTARWFAALGELESLAALGALAHANPDWCQPDVIEGEAHAPRLSARALGHPLLAPDVRVPNDLELGPPGSFMLITGSNMSGKSTLLRAIGANAVLAQAGAPACAAELRLTPLATCTSMRVRDSLAEGLSLFMAELVRLKAMVDAARARDGGRAQLFLLDELLQGTNSAERRLAARVIIGHLLQTGAIGAVTTHDLALADAPELRAAAHAFHMSEAISTDPTEPALRFAYELRPGLSTSVNAMLLLERMGLK
ncbi:MAG: hypothetical protein ABJD07_12140 [Gemmatimonadaceae bacterium]